MFCKRIATIFMPFTMVLMMNASAGDGHHSELMVRITKASKELKELELNISREKTDFSKQLNESQMQIETLRLQVKSIQRAHDEQILSIDQLKNRVSEWENQSKFQKHILTNFHQKMNSTINGSFEQNPLAGKEVEVLVESIKRIYEKLNPKWLKTEIVFPSGEIKSLDVLEVGPVAMAYDSIANNGGPLISSADNDRKILDVLTQNQAVDLKKLHQSGLGRITFDPTLDSAHKIMNSKDSLKSHLIKGGVWVVPILIAGMLSMLVALLKTISLIRLPKINGKIIDALEEVVAQNTDASHGEIAAKALGIIPNKTSAQGKLVEIAINHPMSQKRDDLLVSFLFEHKHSVEKYLGVIATSAVIAPLLGLLGTVSGMISMFKMMTLFGSGDASTVSGGISEALITTELGLIVAIPALVMTALLSRAFKAYEHRLESFAIKLSKLNFGKLNA
jgi:biopolymer transport protein ExbB